MHNLYIYGTGCIMCTTYTRYSRLVNTIIALIIHISNYT